MIFLLRALATSEGEVGVVTVNAGSSIVCSGRASIPTPEVVRAPSNRHPPPPVPAKRFSFCTGWGEWGGRSLLVLREDSNGTVPLFGLVI